MSLLYCSGVRGPIARSEPAPAAIFHAFCLSPGTASFKAVVVFAIGGVVRVGAGRSSRIVSSFDDFLPDAGVRLADFGVRPVLLSVRFIYLMFPLVTFDDC